MKLRAKPLVAAVSGLFVGAMCLSNVAQAAKSQPPAQDLGAASSTATRTVSIVLQLRNQDALNSFISDTVDPNSPRYHQFLSVQDFAKRYAPTDADINRVKADLSKQGIQVSEVYQNHLVLHATGTTAQFNKYFATEVHNFKENGLSYIKPAVPLTLPSSVSDVVLAVTGLDTKPRARSLSHNLSNHTKGALKISPALSTSATGVTTTNQPGAFTVTDVAELYNITPLYNQHVLGQHHKIGIATFATFTASDAYTYWQSVGLNVASDKIKEIPVDGGTGTDGSGETTLDVEQSGGIAPAAKVYVYEAPNTDQGFVDVFLNAANDNEVDTLSMSWGGTEFAQDPGVIPATHQALMELAAQGITVLTSAGDEGAYDINNNQGYYAYPGCTETLSVEYPASDTLILASGGITLAGTQTFVDANGNTIGSVTVPKDRAWAWDYLQNFFETSPLFGEAFYYANLFPVGGGGGVSVEFDLPYYQKHLHGTQLTAPNQSLICQSSTGPQDLIDLPDAYAGRNVPDISLNADPDTGYAEYVGGGWQYGWGGTSFVAPQLNGISILVSQVAGTRLGFLNPQLYARFRQFGYDNNSPFRAITSGDNEFYQSTHGYNPATGIGAIDATKLAKSFSSWGY